MSTQRPAKKQPARRSKMAIWVPVVLALVTTVGTVVVAVAKAPEAPSFSLQLSFQFSASNTVKDVR